MLYLLTTVYTTLLATAYVMLLRLGPYFCYALYYRIEYDGRTRRARVSHVIALGVQLYRCSAVHSIFVLLYTA